MKFSTSLPAEKKSFHKSLFCNRGMIGIRTAFLQDKGEQDTYTFFFSSVLVFSSRLVQPHLQDSQNSSLFTLHSHQLFYGFVSGQIATALILTHNSDEYRFTFISLLTSILLIPEALNTKGFRTEIVVWQVSVLKRHG